MAKDDVNNGGYLEFRVRFGVQVGLIAVGPKDADGDRRVVELGGGPMPVVMEGLARQQVLADAVVNDQPNEELVAQVEGMVTRAFTRIAHDITGQKNGFDQVVEMVMLAACEAIDDWQSRGGTLERVEGLRGLELLPDPEPPAGGLYGPNGERLN